MTDHFRVGNTVNLYDGTQILKVRSSLAAWLLPTSLGELHHVTLAGLSSYQTGSGLNSQPACQKGKADATLPFPTGRRSQRVSLPQYPVSDQGHPGDVIGGGVTQVCLTRKLVPGTEEHPQHSIRYAAGTPYHDRPGFLIHFMVSQDFLPFFHLSPLTCCLQALGRGLVMQKGQ